MALKDWKKIRNKLIWRNSNGDVVSIYERTVNIENYKGSYVHGFTGQTKSSALRYAKSYMRNN